MAAAVGLEGAHVNAAACALAAAGAQLCASALHDQVTVQGDAATGGAAACGGDGSTLPEVRSADADSATLGTVGVQGSVDQGGVAGGDGDAAAVVAGGAARGICRAGLEHVVAQQGDGAAHVLDGAGFNDAAVVDDPGQQGIFGTSAHDDLAAVGLDQLFVLSQAGQGVLIHLHLDQAVVLEGECGGAACAQGDAAELGADGSLVADGVAQQGHIATVGCGDGALVDDAAGAIALEAAAVAVAVEAAAFQADLTFEDE